MSCAEPTRPCLYTNGTAKLRFAEVYWKKRKQANTESICRDYTLSAKTHPRQGVTLVPVGKRSCAANQGSIWVATSFIEEINVRINKDITFQSAAHTYGAKGAWTNLHVAILAYDVKLSQYTLVDDATAAVNAERDAAMEIVDHTKQLGLGFTGKSLASKVAVSDLSCEYTIYFKEA